MQAMANHRQIGDQRRGTHFTEKKRKSGGATLNEGPLEESKSSEVALVSHWLSCGILFLTEIVCWTRGSSSSW